MKGIIIGLLVLGCGSLSITSVSAHSTDTIEKATFVKSDLDTSFVYVFNAPAILSDVFVFEPLVASHVITAHSEPRKATVVAKAKRLFHLPRGALRS